MFDQTIVKSTLTCSLLSLPVFMPESGIEVTAQSLGSEISEDELASELRNETCADGPDQPTPQIDPAEFETLYTIFLS